MAVLTVNAASVGAREISRLSYATDTLGGAVGIGVVATVVALFLAASSALGGRLMDVRDARPFLVGTVLAGGTLSAVNGWILTRGPMPLGWLVTSTAIETIIFGVATQALLKVQAATVEPHERGRAETVNILRNGIGTAVGTVAAGAIGDTSITMRVSGAVSVAVGLVIAAIVTPMSMPASSPARRRLRDLVPTVRTRPALRRTVTIDLVLAAVLPTQLVALVLVDLDATEVAATAFASALLGVLAGRMFLATTGLRGRPAHQLRVAYLGYLVLCVAAVPALIDGWLIDQTVLFAAILFAGSALLAFAQSLPVALLQQQVPDEFRGTLSGAMNAARTLLAGATAALATVVTELRNASVLTAGVVAMLVVGYLVADRFRGLTATTEA